MTRYREILRLDNLGFTRIKIAESCQCSRNTVTKVLQKAERCGIKYPLPDDMSDKALAEKLFPHGENKPVYKTPDYEYVHREMKKSGVTLNLLWLEYCDECRLADEIPYQSTQFNKYYNDYILQNNVTMHIQHKPGEMMQVDWCGDTASVVNTDTGEIIAAYVFVAVLPYSGYSYAEAFFSMDQENWVTAHVNAYKYFGGVTRIIQCDNLKTGVDKHSRTEVLINKTYHELAEHYGTAVIPCRVRSPKDKAYVEGTVGIISTFILAAIRNQQFLSLSELNTAIHERLDLFNSKPFQKKEGSRVITFKEELSFLLPLPRSPFELSIWKTATVGLNYHISIDHMNYSVPYEYIRQKVDVRLARNTVEIFFEGNRICSHARLFGNENQYSTITDHMPPNHQQYIQWNSGKFIEWACDVGRYTEMIVRAIFDNCKAEQQGYKSCIGIVKLADKYTPERLENACIKALTFTSQPSLKIIQSILRSDQDRSDSEPEPKSEVSSKYGFTRGADYYDRRKK